jgi:hypothetical protein
MVKEFTSSTFTISGVISSSSAILLKKVETFACNFINCAIGSSHGGRDIWNESNRRNASDEVSITIRNYNGVDFIKLRGGVFVERVSMSR